MRNKYRRYSEGSRRSYVLYYDDAGLGVSTRVRSEKHAMNTLKDLARRDDWASDKIPFWVEYGGDLAFRGVIYPLRNDYDIVDWGIDYSR